MKCPRCETSALDERERDGVTIDVCRQCRGIWLDRGKLEKLITRATEEDDVRERRGGYDDDDDHDIDRARGRGYKDEDRSTEVRGNSEGRGRKRRWYESLTDIFD